MAVDDAGNNALIATLAPMPTPAAINPAASLPTIGARNGAITETMIDATTANTVRSTFLPSR